MAYRHLSRNVKLLKYFNSNANDLLKLEAKRFESEEVPDMKQCQGAAQRPTVPSTPTQATEYCSTRHSRSRVAFPLYKPPLRNVATSHYVASIPNEFA